MVGGGTGTQTLSAGAESFVPMLESLRALIEADVEQALPFAGTLSKLQVRIDGTAGPAGSGEFYSFVIRQNGVSTPVTCVILETATSCADMANSVVFAAGDLIAVLVVPSASNPNARAMRWTAQFSAQ